MQPRIVWTVPARPARPARLCRRVSGRRVALGRGGRCVRAGAPVRAPLEGSARPDLPGEVVLCHKAERHLRAFSFKQTCLETQGLVK